MVNSPKFKEDLLYFLSVYTWNILASTSEPALHVTDQVFHETHSLQCPAIPSTLSPVLYRSAIQVQKFNEYIN